jgi:hypothetical protein
VLVRGGEYRVRVSCVCSRTGWISVRERERGLCGAAAAAAAANPKNERGVMCVCGFAGRRPRHAASVSHQCTAVGVPKPKESVKSCGGWHRSPDVHRWPFTCPMSRRTFLLTLSLPSMVTNSPFVTPSCYHSSRLPSPWGNTGTRE